ncbi:MAG: hypothetical protein JO300_08120 [Silvibacterium sp.]|nr:hypothetical protein [Silvibacterium sp.]
MNKSPKFGVFEREKGSGTWWIRFLDEYSELQEQQVGSKKEAIEAYRDIREDVRAERKLLKYLSNVEHEEAKKQGRVSGRDLEKAFRIVARYISENSRSHEGHAVSQLTVEVDKYIADNFLK